VCCITASRCCRHLNHRQHLHCGPGTSTSAFIWLSEHYKHSCKDRHSLTPTQALWTCGTTSEQSVHSGLPKSIGKTVNWHNSLRLVGTSLLDTSHQYLSEQAHPADCKQSHARNLKPAIEI
jgi:hypothetical protein